MEAVSFACRLPFPPTINHYWRRVGRRTLLSREGRRYRTEVVARLAAGRVRPLGGRLEVWITIHPPDRRRFDLDNRIKALADALQHAGVFEDDEQIDRLTIARGPIVPGGKAVVEIATINDHGTSTLSARGRRGGL